MSATADAALQGAKLRFARVAIGEHRRQALHQLLGRHARLGFQPPLDRRPAGLERVLVGAPPMGRSGVLAVRGPHLALFPGTRQSGSKCRQLRGLGRSGCMALSGERRQLLLGGAHVMQEAHGIELSHLLAQLRFDRFIDRGQTK